MLMSKWNSDLKLVIQTKKDNSNVFIIRSNKTEKAAILYRKEHLEKMNQLLNENDTCRK